MFKSLSGSLRKLLPTILLLAVAILAGATDIFSNTVHDVVGKLFADYGQKVLPFAIQALIGGIVINIAYLLYQPIRGGVEKALQRQGTSERGKNLALKTLQLAYWGLAVFLAAAIIAPDLLSKLFLGISLLGAALTLAMQGAANDFISGVLLHFSPKLKEGDDIALVGLEVKGKVQDIGYLSTRIDGPDGLLVVPNREVWSRAVKVVKPVKAPSLIIIPPGVNLDK
jgi:small-conductance mechanosensitive channel